MRSITSILFSCSFILFYFAEYPQYFATRYTFSFIVAVGVKDSVPSGFIFGFDRGDAKQGF